jgi:hypothetical protein
MDEDSRSFTEAEVKFFSQCDTGSSMVLICHCVLSTDLQFSVPVIVLFTKFDALYDDEFAELISKGVSRKDAEALAPQHAKDTFANGPQLKLLYNRKGNQRPPRCHICLPSKSTNSRATNKFAAYPRSGTFRYGQGWRRLRATYRMHG